MILLLDGVDTVTKVDSLPLFPIVLLAQEEKEITPAVIVLATCLWRTAIPYLAKTHIGQETINRLIDCTALPCGKHSLTSGVAHTHRGLSVCKYVRLCLKCTNLEAQ